jgi:hypothetical protein
MWHLIIQPCLTNVNHIIMKALKWKMSYIEPLDKGVIYCVKYIYLKYLVHFYLQEIQWEVLGYFRLHIIHSYLNFFTIGTSKIFSREGRKQQQVS